MEVGGSFKSHCTSEEDETLGGSTSPYQCCVPKDGWYYVLFCFCLRRDHCLYSLLKNTDVCRYDFVFCVNGLRTLLSFLSFIIFKNNVRLFFIPQLAKHSGLVHMIADNAEVGVILGRKKTRTDTAG